jgi:hypothetical protein
MKSPIKISLQKQTLICKIAISYITAQKINFIVVKLLPILILFLSFLFHQNLQAQQDNILFSETYISQEYVLDNNVNQGLNISKIGFIPADKNNHNLLIDNIQINQIGDYNKSQVYLKTAHSDLTLNQYGVNNDISIYKSNPEIKQMIKQMGNSNFVNDFSINSNYKVDMQINQHGNNLTLFNNGTNSISKEMKVTQTGNSGTIFIYNR